MCWSFLFLRGLMERVYRDDGVSVNKVKEFLELHHLRLEDHDELYVLKENNKIVASGAIKGNVLKCIAVEKSDNNHINTVMSYLVNRTYELGCKNVFIYTKPETYKSFEYLGFKKIASAENVVLMENAISGFEDYLNKLENKDFGGIVGSVVVNCNPFTLGHRHLIEYASKNCDLLHIFVVWEDESTFPNDIRYQLIEQGISHIGNVILHKGKDYIISNATFPSYFLKQDVDITREQIELDLNIFKIIANRLDIKKRFVGQEPLNPVTGEYNRLMKTVLSDVAIDVVEIPRITTTNGVISASAVRMLLVQGKFNDLRDYVPSSTYDFLVSKEAEPIIYRLRKTFNANDLV